MDQLIRTISLWTSLSVLLVTFITTQMLMVGVIADRTTRRRVVTSGGFFVVLGLAGCVGTDEPRGEPTVTETPPSSLQLPDRALSSAFPLELVDPDASVENMDKHVTGDPLVAKVQYHDPQRGGAHWHFFPLIVPLNDIRRVRVRFVTPDYSAVPLRPNSRYQLEISTPGDGDSGVIDVTVNEDIVTFSGETQGATERVFELWDTTAETVQWASPPLNIETRN